MTSQAAISTAGLTEALPRCAGAHRPDARGPNGHHLWLPRTERSRQDDGTQVARRPDPADPRTRQGGRHPGRGRACLPPPGRLSQPGPALLRLDDRARDHRVRRIALSRRRTARSRPSAGPRARRAGRRGRPPVRTYSGGMRQRLGIAQALVARPPVLLLDEPVSSLDPIGRREVLELMQQIKGEATVFYSTHILDDVQRVSDHVAILDRGRLVLAQPTADLLSSFTRDRMRVVLGFATDETAMALAAIPAWSRSSRPIATPTRGHPAHRSRCRRPNSARRHPARSRVRTSPSSTTAPSARTSRTCSSPRRHQGACSMTALASRTPRALWQGAPRMAPRAPYLGRPAGERPVHDADRAQRLAPGQPGGAEGGGRSRRRTWTPWSTS